MQAGRRLYSLRPKLHYLDHSLLELRQQLDKQRDHLVNPHHVGVRR